MSAAVRRGEIAAASVMAELLAAGKETGDHAAVFAGAIMLLAGGMSRAAGFEATVKVLSDCVEITKYVQRTGGPRG